MADPISILAGTASLADIATRIVSYLTDVYKAAATIDDDIAALIHETQDISTVSSLLGDAYQNQTAILTNTKTGQHSRVLEAGQIWGHVQTAVNGCQTVVKRLEDIISEIAGKNGTHVTGRWGGWTKAQRRRGRDGDLRQCRDQLQTYRSTLQLLLSLVTM